jgi:hypothetical protein
MNRTTDRVFTLTVKEGFKPKDSREQVDSRLFTGDNKLHAKWDFNTNLWRLELDNGSLPEPLKQRFTKFEYAERIVKTYYEKRNVTIKEVIG